MTETTLSREQLLVAAMASCPGARYSPVQIQKLIFVVDRELAGPVGGPFYDFRPYDYGPFDATVYADLEALELVSRNRSHVKNAVRPCG